MARKESPEHKEKVRKHKHKDKEKSKDKKEHKKDKHKEHKKDKHRDDRELKNGDRDREQDKKRARTDKDTVKERSKADDRSKEEEQFIEKSDRPSSPDDGEIGGATSPSERGQSEPGGGGELSLSIEETNKLRISLGLKPLKVSSGPSKAELEARAKKEEEEKAAEAEQLANKIKEQRERRLQQEKLSNTKTLGEQDEEGEDLMAWVNKSRQLEQKRKEEERKKAERLARALDEQDDVDEDESSGEEDEYGVKMKYSGRDLAGLKVKEGLDQLNEGETVIMTLEDKPILDEKGQLNEEEDALVNTRAREEAQRAKARRAAAKTAKPLFEEDGRKRALLDKYDEEDEVKLMEITADGEVEMERHRRQEEIRKKLATAGQLSDHAEPAKQVASEYYTQEEASALFKPKKKKKKEKERKIRRKELAATIEALEADVEMAGTGGGPTDLGSRAERRSRADREAEVAAKEVEEKRQRFDRALEKANHASLAMHQGEEEEEAVGEEEELYESLARARRAAEKAATSASGGIDVVQQVAAQRREEDERKAREDAKDGGLAFTSTSEFVRSVVVNVVDEKAASRDADAMDIEEEAVAPSVKKGSKSDSKRSGRGNWISADADETMQDAYGGDAGPSSGAQPVTEADESVLRETAVGKGLAGALQVLRNRGELKGGLDKVEWSGRTNDMRKDKLIGLDEVYQGGGHDDKLARSIETALTHRDELGRVMTPKEAFRQLSYKFHGKAPSKNKEEKRLRKQAEHLAKKRSATQEAATSSTDILRRVQQVTQTPYVVLSGQIKAGQISDPASGYATVDKVASLATPILGGGATPLMGNRKVEAMLGVRGKADGSMPPPPPKMPRN